MIYYYSKKELTMKKLSLVNYVAILFILLGIGSSLGFSGAIKVNDFIEKVPVIIRPNQNALTENNLRNEIKKIRNATK